MLNENIESSFGILKNIIFSPNRIFKKIGKGEYDFAVYFLFGMSGLITFFKSFGIKTYKNNYFVNEHFNILMSFFNIPQIKWLFAFISFFLFVFFMKILCLFLLKKCKKKHLMLGLLSVSSAGILLQIVFSVLHYILSQTFIYILSYIAFIWIVCLSIMAIKNSQDTSYVKSAMIYIFSGLPVFLVIGLTGLAPFLLWLVSPVVFG
ncbi:MAG: hypothetical protein JEZ12_12390 [Desulfobacterium sp.]|nr:hypothetical protein [Desulfobacterium sp.]